MFMDRFLTRALICLLLVGCSSSARQEYLVTAEDRTHKNYFRVTIQANAYLTISEFQIGNVDPVVVDRLLGEWQRVILDVPQEKIDKSEEIKRLAKEIMKPTTQKVDPATGKLLPDSKVVIVLSSDSNIIFTQFKAIADTQIISQTIGNVILKREKASKKKSDAELLRMSGYMGKLAELLQGVLDSRKLDSEQTGTEATLHELSAILEGPQP